MADDTPDDAIDCLARLFREHPAWIAAARHLLPEATSTVYFSHRRDAWHMEQREGETQLLVGAAASPDFVFRFTPMSIERLAAVQGGIGDFAVELFTLVTEEDPALQIGFRVAAGFPRLVRRGYLRLLLEAGPRVTAFGVLQGIESIGALRRFVAQLLQRKPESWEDDGGGDASEQPRD